MSDGKILYHKDILNHSRSPKGYGKIDDADVVMRGDSPICGDHMTLYMNIIDDRVFDIRFEAEACCAICRASSSMMSALLIGKEVEEAKSIHSQFLSMIKSGDEGDLPNYLDEISIFSKIAQVPSRYECAALAWVAFEKGLLSLERLEYRGTISNLESNYSVENLAQA